MEIDLNVDVGESFGEWRLGEDETLIPLVSSVSIACGFHAGDPRTMERTVALAARSGAAIGAHPGYPDLVGFGRRDLAMASEDLEAAVVYQIGALAAFANGAGVELRHVKPHGALYNRAAADPLVARALVRAVRRVSRSLRLVGLAGSILLDAAADAGLTPVAEAFPDRAYEPDGRLRSRTFPDSLVDDPETVGRRAVAMALERQIAAVDGTVLEVRAATLCIHGDRPGAAARARAARTALDAAGILVQSPV